MAQREFLDNPGSPGGFGALMDEYARAAEDLCRVVEVLAPDRFREERSSADKDTVSAREICRHVGRASLGYATNLFRARGVSEPWPFQPDERIAVPADVRGVLEQSLRHTERAIEPWRALPDDEIGKITFQVSWGATYDPESMLEHAICHLLRHRRQLERW